MWSFNCKCLVSLFNKICLQSEQKKYKEKSGTGGHISQIKFYGLNTSSSSLTMHLKSKHGLSDVKESSASGNA